MAGHWQSCFIPHSKIYTHQKLVLGSRTSAAWVWPTKLALRAADLSSDCGRPRPYCSCTGTSICARHTVSPSEAGPPCLPYPCAQPVLQPNPPSAAAIVWARWLGERVAHSLRGQHVAREGVVPACLLQRPGSFHLQTSVSESSLRSERPRRAGGAPPACLRDRQRTSGRNVGAISSNRRPAALLRLRTAATSNCHTQPPSEGETARLVEGATIVCCGCAGCV